MFYYFRDILCVVSEKNYAKIFSLYKKNVGPDMILMVSGQLPPTKIAPWLGLGLGLGLVLVLGFRGGANFLGGNCPRTDCGMGNDNIN